VNPVDEYPNPPSERVALVTGASRGIGAAVAAKLAADGATVILAARSRDALDERVSEIEAAGGSALAITVDLADRASIDQLAHQVRGTFNRLDILINNAGVLPPARRLEKFAAAEWDSILQINLHAARQLSFLARELMRANGGVIVNVASTASFYPSIGLGPYCVSKAALVMLTRACALEWAADGIRVLGIAPGKVKTELVEPILDYLKERHLPLNPIGRVGEPTEVAELVAYLVSPAAAYVTGTIVPIDGGELTGVPA
jgi:NAD(P)-dependent dehydrogenase (short-subunit alcohol dehydrogenase family)